MSLESFSDDIVQKLKDGKTYAEISDHLKAMGLQRGSSEANIRKFCRELGINPREQTVAAEDLDKLVFRASAVYL